MIEDSSWYFWLTTERTAQPLAREELDYAWTNIWIIASRRRLLATGDSSEYQARSTDDNNFVRWYMDCLVDDSGIASKYGLHSRHNSQPVDRSAWSMNTYIVHAGKYDDRIYIRCDAERVLHPHLHQCFDDDKTRQNGPDSLEPSDNNEGMTPCFETEQIQALVINCSKN